LEKLLKNNICIFLGNYKPREIEEFRLANIYPKLLIKNTIHKYFSKQLAFYLELRNHNLFLFRIQAALQTISTNPPKNAKNNDAY